MLLGKTRRKKANKKPRDQEIRGFLNGEPGNVLLSLEIQPTIIGAKAFHCPVRNGKEWDHPAMVARLSLLSDLFTFKQTRRILFGVTKRSRFVFCSLELYFFEQQAVRL